MSEVNRPPWNGAGKKVIVKTAAEYVAEAAGELWACPRCGCRDSRVIDSRFDGVTRNRIRVCRNCHTPLPRTQEIPVPDGHKLEVVPDPTNLHIED